MSAIWGIVDLENKEIEKNKALAMNNEFKKYKLDEISYILRKNIFIGCGKQHITMESINEILPYYDETFNLMITADAIIDNRDELIEKLSLDKYKGEISDSYLILEAYKRWGEDCPKYLIGDFCFVIVDKDKLFVVRDHCGHRSLYYCIDENKVIFSTTLNPFKAVLNKKIEVNELWTANYLINGFVMPDEHMYDTIYESIFLVPTATAITIRGKDVSSKRFWNPLEQPELKFKNDEECFREFRKVLNDAIKCRLRTTGDVGVLLSGGLDSSAVASFASLELKKKEKRLKAYSYVPFKDYINKERGNLVPDESKYIKKTLSMYDNIDIKYCTGYDKNCIEVVDEVLEKIEQPYLAIENAPWMLEISDCSTNKCKVLLTGQYGNLSISYGSYISNMKTLIDKKKYLDIFKEIRGVSKISGKSSIKILKNTIDYFRKENDSNKTILNNIKEYNSLLSSEFIEKYKDFISKEMDSISNFDYMKVMRFENLMKNTVGVLDTILGLNSSLVYRDPTKDKRVVEFCLRLPYRYFCRDGKDRFLVREAMNGLIHDDIRLNYKKRGVQGSDWTQRLKRDGEINKNKILSLIKGADNKFIDYKLFKKEVDNFDKLVLIENSMILKNIIKEYVLFKFISE